MSKKYGKEISVMFFADLIEVTNENWHDAVEGYLNTQRMNIFVAPEYFMDAYEIYKQIRKDLAVHEYRVVDSQKVYAADKKIVPNSLSFVVKSDNQYALAYAQHLLGNVTCCYDDAKIRDNKTSVTQICMSYSGYTVGPLNQNAYLNPYIGQNSIFTQIKTKLAELEQLKLELAQVESYKKAVFPIVDIEWFLTESYISSTVENVFNFNINKKEWQLKLDEIQLNFDKIDMFWIKNMDDNIALKCNERKIAYDEREKVSNSITEFKQKKQDTDTKQIPTLTSSKDAANETVIKSFKTYFIENIGIPNYNSELQNRQTAVKIISAFESLIKVTQTQISEKSAELTEARSEYNRLQNVSFNISDMTSNTIFSDEYNKIKNYELPKYRAEIEKAKNDAMEQFKSDFLYKLKSNIEMAYNKIEELNKALKSGHFGDDSYRFSVKPNPAYSEYYGMIMSDSLTSSGESLFSYNFTNQY